MRPQIRSLPLCKVECPQFSWAVRNNSENVSVALQPDIHQDLQDNEEESHFSDQESDKLAITIDDSCYCLEQRLKPTLFPHPVSCVCSNEPRPPSNEKYRYCKLKMDQAIGDAMEEIVLDNIPPPAPPPPTRTDKVMTKMIRSAYIPDQVDLTDENACVECLAKDPTLLKELLESIKYKKTPEVKKSNRKSCIVPGEGRNRRNVDDGFDCFKEEPTAETEMGGDKRCKWRKDVVCTCKQKRHDVCGDCDKCKCKCRKSCLKCTCQRPASSKASPRFDVKTSTKALDTEAKDERGDMKTKRSTKRVPQGSAAKDEDPLLSSPTEKKTGRKDKKTKTKGSKKKSKWKKPDNIICERFEFIENNPYSHDLEEPKLPEPVQIYEHFRSVTAVRSGSSKTASEALDNQNLTQAKSTTTQKNSTSSSLSGTKNLKRGSHRQKKPSKIPWNWNNQPKTEDPMKGWGGTKYSWSKRLNYAKLDKKMEEDSQRTDRSRGGDDVAGRSEPEEPRFFQYKPNLTPRDFNETTVTENEEEIKEKEQRKYRNGYGRIRVRSWHQALQEDCRDRTESPKEKSEFSDDDAEDEKEDKEDHDRKQCLQCLMSDVQQRFLGSSNNLCTHKIEDTEPDPDLEARPDDPEGSECPSGRRLPTIIEENPNKRECRSDGSAELGQTYRVANEESKPEIRPKTADPHPPDSPEKPFFNVIKQRIHSRNKTLENLDSFRADLFPKKTDEEHTCVHRFTIDDRLFPKPLHCDESGTSCCVHCDKPMTASEKSVFLDQRDSKEKVEAGGCVQKQVSKFSLRPKPVHIGSRNSVMEIRLRSDHNDLLKGYGEGRKREFHPDSLALRHQRR